MSALVILDSQKKNLEFLRKQPPNVFADFCKLTTNFLIKGTNPQLYQSASEKFNIDREQIWAGIESLAYLFIEAQRNKLTKEGFKETIENLGFPETFFQTLYEEYLSQKDPINNALPLSEIQNLKYKNLEWRFETQVSSKSMSQQLHPRVIMKLELEKGEETKKICLHSDIPNLIHMNKVIGLALQDSKTQHLKRILRLLT